MLKSMAARSKLKDLITQQNNGIISSRFRRPSHIRHKDAKNDRRWRPYVKLKRTDIEVYECASSVSTASSVSSLSSVSFTSSVSSTSKDSMPFDYDERQRILDEHCESLAVEENKFISDADLHSEIVNDCVIGDECSDSKSCKPRAVIVASLRTNLNNFGNIYSSLSSKSDSVSEPNLSLESDEPTNSDTLANCEQRCTDIGKKITKEVSHFDAEYQKNDEIVDRLIEYFENSQVYKESVTEIIKFSKHCGLLPKDTPSETFQDLKYMQFNASINFKNFGSRYLYKIKTNMNVTTLYACVYQILRFVTNSSHQSLENIPIALILNQALVESFIWQFEDVKLMKLYAKSYKYLVAYICEVLNKSSLIDPLVVHALSHALDDIIRQKETEGVGLHKHFVTRQTNVLKYVYDILNKNTPDPDFVINYLNAYLQLECYKPAWVLQEATFFEYNTGVNINNCLVQLVFRGRLRCVVVWRDEALQLLRYYVSRCRPKVYGRKLFLKFDAAHFFSDLNLSKFIRNLNKDAILSERITKSLKCTKCIQTTEYSVNVDERKSCQTDFEVDSDNDVRIVYENTNVTSGFKQLTPQSKSEKNVATNCNSQIMLKTVNTPEVTWFRYEYKIHEQQKLFQATRADLRMQNIKPSTVEAAVDPIAMSMKNAFSQTNLDEIIKVKNYVDASVETEPCHFVIPEQLTVHEHLKPTIIPQHNENQQAGRSQPPSVKTLLTNILASSSPNDVIDCSNEALNSFEDCEVDPIIIDIISEPKPASDTTNSIELALRHKLPTLNNSPLMLRETGLSHEIYFRYVKEFRKRQANVRANIIVDNILSSVKIITDDRVEEEALKYDWTFDKILLDECLSKKLFVKH